LAATELIEEILRNAERLYVPAEKKCKVRIQDVVKQESDDDGLIRINSKIIRPRHITLSKSEELYEAHTRLNNNQSLDLLVETEKKHTKSESDQNGKLVNLPQVSPNDDLAALPELTEKIILQELMKRYKVDQVYTYVGDILIAVNPFKELPIYSSDASLMYKNIQDRKSKCPHIFAVADWSYQSLLRTGQPQCCVISGESGAGKTESCKYLIQHLLTRAKSQENLLSSKIQQINPLLEAFGNAQTVMNDNSSRFGKFLELLFNFDGHVQGAQIHEYLLEKSRVVYQSNGESNFHIFYLMFAGLSPDEYKKFGIESPRKHRYLSGSSEKFKSLMTQENRERFGEIRDCLEAIGFSKDDEDNLMTTLSAILHLGDLKFKPCGTTDAAVLVNLDILDKVADMLQVPSEELGSALVAEFNVTRGETIRRDRNVIQANDCRDALAKALYGRLFGWIVNNINQMLQPLEESGPSLPIGVLDIFGFENFSKNSFEQICINLANEQLQYYFNQHIFQWEQEECAKEGIQLERINYTSNKHIVELFLQRHSGILAILDEESHFPKATDESLATKLHTGPGKSSKKVYMAPKDGGVTFSIMHYAGKVSYDLKGVLDKNRDTLPNSIQFTMKTSSSLLIREMFQSRLTRTGSLAPSARQRQSRRSSSEKESNVSPFDFFRKKRTTQNDTQRVKENLHANRSDRPVIGTDRKGPSTVAFHFKNSLADLMHKMTNSSPHFIRCIKPGIGKLPNSFTPDYVIAQLRYTGVLETTKIRRQGYPLRITFEEFLKRHAVLKVSCIPWNREMSDLDRCILMLKYCKLKDWQVGTSKLFLRYWHVEKLNQMCIMAERKINICQTVVRGFLGRRQFHRHRSLHRRQQAFISKFLAEIEHKPKVMSITLGYLHEHDMVRRLEKEIRQVAEDEEENIRRASLNMENQSVTSFRHDGDSLTSHVYATSISKSSTVNQTTKQREVYVTSIPASSTQNKAGAVYDTVYDAEEEREEPQNVTHQTTEHSVQQLLEISSSTVTREVSYKNVPRPPPPQIHSEEHSVQLDLAPPTPVSEEEVGAYQNISATRKKFMNEQVQEQRKSLTPEIEYSVPPSELRKRFESKSENDKTVNRTSYQPDIQHGVSPADVRAKFDSKEVTLREATRPEPPKRDPKTRLSSTLDDVVIATKHASQMKNYADPSQLPAADYDYPPPDYPSSSSQWKFVQHPSMLKAVNIKRIPAPMDGDIYASIPDRLYSSDIPSPPPCAPPPPPCPPSPVPKDGNIFIQIPGALSNSPDVPLTSADSIPPPPSQSIPLPPPLPPPNLPPGQGPPPYSGYPKMQADAVPPASVSSLNAAPTMPGGLLAGLSLVTLKKADKPVGSKLLPGDDIKNALMREIMQGVRLRRSQGPRFDEIHGPELCSSSSDGDTDTSSMGKTDDETSDTSDYVSGFTLTTPEVTPTSTVKRYPPVVPKKPKSSTSPAFSTASQSSTPYSTLSTSSSATQSTVPSVTSSASSTLSKPFEISDNIPAWKKALFKRRNEESEQQLQAELRKKEMEDSKWEGVPEWKKSLLIEKERKQKMLNAPLEAERQRQAEEVAKLQSMPTWKRKIIIKKMM
uniref:Unconventional myosin-XVI-like n=1 Tax=Saccoglossus kowalevskii TaxID=10224 RepID=A0ABM0M8X5_SACKO